MKGSTPETIDIFDGAQFLCFSAALANQFFCVKRLPVFTLSCALNKNTQLEEDARREERGRKKRWRALEDKVCY